MAGGSEGYEKGLGPHRLNLPAVATRQIGSGPYRLVQVRSSI
jgi:hypothetical protein